MGQFVKLQNGELKELRKINPALVSYNVEMTEVTGGNLLESLYTGTDCRYRGSSAAGF